MKKFIYLVLLLVSITAYAYDSCPCPDGDPGHTDHIKSVGNPCVKDALRKGASLDQAKSVCEPKVVKERSLT